MWVRVRVRGRGRQSAAHLAVAAREVLQQQQCGHKPPLGDGGAGRVRAGRRGRSGREHLIRVRVKVRVRARARVRVRVRVKVRVGIIG